jgi:hypothetical protein
MDRSKQREAQKKPNKAVKIQPDLGAGLETFGNPKEQV